MNPELREFLEMAEKNFEEYLKLHPERRPLHPQTPLDEDDFESAAG